MKRLLFALGFVLAFNANARAEEDNVNNIAQNIYDICDKNTPIVTESSVIKGNIEDVRRERALRRCLKDKVIEISQSYMRKDEIDSFQKNLNQLEDLSFALYKSLIFCGNDSDENWCETRPYDDESLGKLLLEKQITAQTYRILQNIVEAQQGGFMF